VRDLRDHPRLRAGRCERQLRDERVVPSGRRHDRPRAAGRFTARTPERRCERDAEEFLEDDAPATAIDIIHVVRSVNAVPRVARRRKAESRGERRRQRVAALADQPVEILRDRGADRARRKFLRRGVHRDDLADVRFAVA
jgi:hypothetical protein